MNRLISFSIGFFILLAVLSSMLFVVDQRQFAVLGVGIPSDTVPFAHGDGRRRYAGDTDEWGPIPDEPAEPGERVPGGLVDRRIGIEEVRQRGDGIRDREEPAGVDRIAAAQPDHV